MKSTLTALALGCAMAVCGNGALAQSVHAAWAQIMGSDGPVQKTGGEMPLNLSLRVVTDQATDCTGFTLAARIPGLTEALVRPTWTPRHNRPGFGFDAVTVCQTDMNEDWDQVRLLASDGTTAITTNDGTDVVLAGAGRRTTAVPQFVVFGDTGCRGFGNARGSQDCSANSTGTGTRFLFEKIAAQAMATAPDLVIHLGDYRYDTERTKDWDKWNSDFFSRVASGALMQVPWAFVRGNHERCDRAGHGWYYFFGPNDDKITCIGDDPRLIKSWYFDLRDSRASNAAAPHRFVFVGTSPTIDKPSEHADNLALDAKSLAEAQMSFEQRQAVEKVDLWNREVAEFSQALAWANEVTAAGEQIGTWLVMHKPIWGLDTSGRYPRRVDPLVGAAFEDAVEKIQGTPCAPYQHDACGLKAVLAAHEHMMTNVVFSAAALPQQYVIGMSGVRLDNPPGAVDGDGLSMGGCRHDMSGLHMAQNVEGIAAEYRGRLSGTSGNDAFGFVQFTRDSDEPSGWAGTAIYVDKKAQTLRNGLNIGPASNFQDCRVP